MPWSLLDILLGLPAYALGLFRVGGLIMTAPLFSSRMIPVRVRTALVFVLTAMIFPIVAKQVPENATLATVLVGGVSELLIGITIGLSLSIFMMGAEVAGRAAGQQAGLAISQVFDPTTDEQVSTLGSLYSIVLTTVFLMIGGHRATIAALLDTYEAIPLFSFQLNESIVLLITEMLAAAFILGIRMAAPIIIAVFLTGVTLGFLSRTMPQLNILSVGFTVRLLIAMGIGGAALAVSGDVMVDAIFNALETVRAGVGLDPFDNKLVS